MTATAEKSSISIQQMFIESFNHSIKTTKAILSHHSVNIPGLSKGVYNYYQGPSELTLGKKFDSMLVLKNGQNHQLTKGGEIGRTCYDSYNSFLCIKEDQDRSGVSIMVA